MFSVTTLGGFVLAAVKEGTETCSLIQRPLAKAGILKKTRPVIESKDVNAGVDDLPSFEAFNAKHGRAYSHGSEEYKLRLALFTKRVAEVRRHNRRPQQSWWAGVNHLADRTEEELKALRGWKGFAGSKSSQSAGENIALLQSKQAVVPDNYSWGHLKAIQTTYDQGGCGSCWALATIAMMNAAEEIAGGNRVFSAQDLVNCVPNSHNCGGSGGCDGATVELAMNWIASSGLRLATESPYEGRDEQCYTKANSTTLLSSHDLHRTPSGAPDAGDLEAMTRVGQHHTPHGSSGQLFGLQYWTRLPENEYHPLLLHLVQHGPLAISVDATGWVLYAGGIFDHCNVDAVINHAVVLFGYGYDDATWLPYWDIKNSWGIAWGQNGNIRLKRESSAEEVQCGTDRQPEMGTGCDGGPKEVRVCGMCGILYDVVSVHMPARTSA